MYFISKKLSSFITLFYLLKLKSHNLEDESSIKKIQNKNINKLMKRAYKIPFYRKKFDECGMFPNDFNTADDLKKFPSLSKQEIREWIVPTVECDTKKYKNWNRVTTSGSSGTPLSIYVSPKENAILSANWLRIAMVNGYNFIKDKTLALKDPELIKRRNGKDSLIQKLGIGRRECLSFLSTGEEIYNFWEKVRPDYVYIHRSKLFQMLMFAESKNVLVYKPKLCAIIGEGIDKNSFELINKHLGEVIFSSYGTMETGACTFTKKGDIDKHIVTQDTHVINITDGKMYITNLFFYGFPIINYDVNDGAERIFEGNSSYICNINGRLNDMLHFEDGSTVDYHSFYSVMEARKDILQFRIIQNDYKNITIQLVENTNYITSRQDVENEIVKEIGNIIKISNIKYLFEWKDELLPDTNGKRRFIISKVHIK